MTSYELIENSLRIDPEPTPEEMVAIVEALRALHPEDDQKNVRPRNLDSPWTLTARRERLRPAEWPQQRETWEMGTK